MNELEFDQALSNFLDDEQCEKINEAVYELVRSAFAAGWKAALGSDFAKFMQIEKRQDENFAWVQEEECRRLGCDCPL